MRLRDNQNNEYLLDLNLQTALLESLNWDEQQLEKLLAFLSDLPNSDMLPTEVIKHISIEYTPAAANIVANIFKEEYILNGLYQSFDEEH